METSEVLALLQRLHHFCSTITEVEFIEKIGHKSTWDRITCNTGHPDLFDLLSYGDMQTRANLANWLINRPFKE